MKLTNKGRYAVMAMADLASNAKEGPISLSELIHPDLGSLRALLFAYFPLFFHFKNV